MYVLIVEWSDGEKYPIYRKYSSFYDFEVWYGQDQYYSHSARGYLGTNTSTPPSAAGIAWFPNSYH